jgi:hypothetical protein
LQFTVSVPVQKERYHLNKTYAQKFGRVLRSVGGVLALLGALLTLTAVFDVGAGTSHAAAQEHKVTICHRTDAVKNPYVKISVDSSAADAQPPAQGDHALEHQGPIASSEAVAQSLKDQHIEWGDIIPPHDNFAGLNWTAAGQAIFRNDCKVPQQPPKTPEAKETPKATQPPRAAGTPKPGADAPVTAVAPEIRPPSAGSGGLSGGADGSAPGWIGFATLLTGLGVLGWSRRLSSRR